MPAIDFLRLVHDAPEVCSYLPAETARMPLYTPAGSLTDEQFDQLLSAGFRRSGYFFYHTRCPACTACEPLRLQVSSFLPSRSQRRADKLAKRHLRLHIGPPQVDSRRLRLFNAHRRQRQLGLGEYDIELNDYRAFLVNSHVRTLEFDLWHSDRLVAVSVTDFGRESMSAVYCYFDPEYAWLSPGTVAILRQIEFARQAGFRWLHLGMYVQANRHLRYKANYRPHERLVFGRWQGTMDRPATEPRQPDSD